MIHTKNQKTRFGIREYFHVGLLVFGCAAVAYTTFSNVSEIIELYANGNIHNADKGDNKSC